MKVRTKSGLLTVLLAVVFALTLCAGIWLAMPAKVQADETSELVPLYGEDLQNCGAPSVKEKGTVWDKTQMRLYFSFKGISKPADENLSGKGVLNGDKMWITDGDGVTMTVQQWKDANRIAWFAPFNGPQGTSAPNALEFWLAITQPDLNPEAPDAPHPQTDANIEWMSKIKSVTILEGFQWETGAGPLAGATVKKTVTLLNNREAGWALSETNPELTTNVKMSVMYDNNVSNDRDASHIYLFFNFEGNAPANVSAFNISSLAGSKVADYIEIDGTKVSTLLGNGTMGWVATWGETFAGPTSRTLLLNFNNADFKANIKKVTVKKGFTWVTRQAGAPEVGWGQADSYLENTNISLDEDVTIYNGGTKGWLSKDPNEGVTQSLSLLTQSEIEGHFNGSGDTAHPEYHQKLGPYWSPTWIRIYFKASSGNLPAGKGVGKGQYNNEENILLTDSTGTSKSVKAWLAEGKLNWIDYSEHGGAQAGYGEIVICSDAAPEWLGGIKSVTVKTGFQWLDDKDAPAGFAAQEDMTIYNGGMEKGWLAEDPNPSEPESTVSVTPAHDDEINNSNYYIDPTHNVYWSDTQMRLFFKVKGLPVSLNTKHGTHQYTTDKIVFTTSDGVSQTLADLKAANKVAWAANSMHELSTRNPESLEIWVAVTEDAAVKEANIAWLKSVAYVTIKEGFQLLDDNSAPIKDAVVKETVYLRNDTTKWSQCTEQDIPKAETSVVPAYGHADATDGLYWGGGNMLRLMFTAKGVNPLPKGTAGLSSENIWAASQSDITKYILINGEEYSKWSSHIGWIAPHVIQNTFDGSVYEIWICSAGVGSTKDNPTQNEHEQWLKAIKTVTLKAGFCFWNQDGKAEGAQIREDVTIWNGGTAGWQRYADSITATLSDGEISQGARLEDYLTVKAKYGTEEETVTGYTLEGYDSTKGGVEQTVTVKYQDKEATVNVTLKAADKTLTGIELSGKTTFTVPRYDELNTEGLIVTAKFSDESETVIEAGNYTVEAFDPWTTESTVTLKVSYEYAGKTCEANITVNVTDPDTTKGLKAYAGYEIYWNNNVTLYFKFEGITAPTKFGNAFAINNFPGNHIVDYIIIRMKDGTEQSYKDWKAGHSDWIAASEDKAHVGADWAKLCINLSGATAEATFAQIESITIKAGFQWVGVKEGQTGSAWGAEEDAKYQNWPGAVIREDVVLWKGDQSMTAGKWQKGATELSAQYNGGAVTAGEHIDKSQLTVTATYYDKSTAAVTDYTLDESELQVAGNGKTVTVKYQNVTATFTVDVKAASKSVTGITLSSETVDVKQFEKPDFSGIKVNVTYSDSTTSSVGLNDEKVTLSAYDTETKGDKQITVTYEELGQSLQKKLTLKVGDPDLTTGLEVFWRSGADTYWRNDDGSSTQLRLHLKMKDGSVLAQVGAADLGTAYNAAQHLKDYILINGQPYSAWSSRIAWIAPFEAIQTMKDQQAYELIICVNEGGEAGAANKEWLKGIHTVELKAGFRWFNASGDVEGAILKEDVTLWNEGTAGWQRYADRITATLTDGDIDQGARLEDYLTVTAHYGEEQEAVTGYTLEGYDSTKGGVEQTVTVKYQDKETTVNVTLKAAVKELTGIELSGKTTFTVPRYDELNTEGLIVTAKFSDESETVIEAGNYTVEAFDPWTTESTVTLKVSYEYAGKTCEANITVNVTDPDTTKGLKAYAGYEIYWNNNVTLYFKFEGITAPTKFGNAFAINNFPGNHIVDYIIIRMKDGTEQSYKDWKAGHSDWIAASEDKSHVGADWAKLCINLSGATAEATFAQIESITIKAGFQWVGVKEGQTGSAWGTEEDAKYQNWPGAVIKEDVVLWKGDQSMTAGKWQKGATELSAQYNGGAVTAGEHIDKSQLTVTATYYDKSTAAVTDYTLDESELQVAGNGKTVTVKYQNVTATFTVDVKAASKSVTGITLSSETVDVKQFEKPDFSGIKVNVTYSDSTTSSVGLNDEKVTLSAYDTETKGDKQITVTYEELGQSLQKKLTLKVGDPDLTTGLEVFWLSGENTYWLNEDGSSTQLRLHLKMKDGSVLAQVGAADVGNAYNAAQHLKDYILINGQPYSAWSSRIAWIAPFEAIQNMIDDQAYELIICVNEGGEAGAVNKEWLKGIHTVELKAGFRWFNASGDVEGAILKEDMKLWNEGEAGWQKYVTSIEASTTQKNPAIGDQVDVSKINATVTYFDNTTDSLTVTTDMLDVTEFNQAGTTTVTITYQEATFGLNFQVTDQQVKGIEIETEPTKKRYRFGTLEPSLEGLVVNKVFKDGKKEPIAVSELTIEGYNPYTLEDQTITVKYGNFSATFTITMEPLETGLEVEWLGTQSFDSAINVEGLTIVISMAGINEPKAVQVPLEARGIIDYIKINGHPAKDYAEYIDWVGFYSWRFVIALNSPDLVWGTESDGSHSAGKSYYVEGRSEVIKTIELLPGFQVYTSKDGNDHWGTEPISMSYLKAMEGVVLTNSVLLYNADGHGWDRVLKQGEGANLDGASKDFKLVPAADAITAKNSGKVTYKKGEKFSIQGFTFTLKFEDGGTQDVSLRRENVDPDSFDPDTLGEQNVIIEIAGGTYILKVTVTEDGQGGEQPGGPGDQPGGPGDQPGGDTQGEEEGGCGGVLGVNALMLMGGACALALLRKRRK